MSRSTGNHAARLFAILLLLLFSAISIVARAETYPARCRVTTTLNVRSGPGTGYS